jgi:DNA-directed RNA polymerase specialized sigma24 family protein
MDRPEHPTEYRLADWHRTQGMSIGPPVTLPRKFLEKSHGGSGRPSCASFRILWRKQLVAVPLTDAEEVPDEDPLPNHILDARRKAAAALAAISELPDRLRQPATLFFVHECSHQDVATFLGLSVATFNNRLRVARLHLKQRMLTMVTNTLHANALPDDFANRIGRLIESRGDVVDALFDPAALPDLLTELTVSDKARKDGVKIHVMRRPGGLPRGLAAALTTRDAPPVVVRIFEIGLRLEPLTEYHKARLLVRADLNADLKLPLVDGPHVRRVVSDFRRADRFQTKAKQHQQNQLVSRRS